MNISEVRIKNTNLNIREMKEKRTILSSLPFKVYIEPTQRCNMDCVMCWDKRRTRKADMKLDLFNRIEKELFPSASEVNFFLVGEPTIAENFTTMIESVSKFTFLPKLFSNGYLVKEEIIKKLVELGFFVNISFDASNKGLFEKIRRGSNYENIIYNISKSLELKEKLKDRRFHIRLSVTTGSYNIHDLPNIVHLSKKLGINDIMVFECDMGNWPHERNLINCADFTLKIFAESLSLADNYKIRFSYPKYILGRHIERNHNWNDFSLPIDEYAPSFLEEYNPALGQCPYPWIQTAIRSDGTIVSCCQKLIKMGNLYESSFKKIWNNKNYIKLRGKNEYYDCQGFCLLTRNSIWKGENIR